MILLSILIPTTPDREKCLYELLSELHSQIEQLKAEEKVEIIVETDNYEQSVGKKRQALLEKAKGEYVVFIDSDDEVNKDYLSSIIESIGKDKPDVIGMRGWMTTNGKQRENFIISKDLLYTTVQDAYGNKEYLRHSNHIVPVKREIALQIGFKDIKFAEDYDYAVRLKQSSLIKTEAFIDRYLYHYKYINPK